MLVCFINSYLYCFNIIVFFVSNAHLLLLTKLQIQALQQHFLYISASDMSFELKHNSINENYYNQALKYQNASPWKQFKNTLNDSEIFFKKINNELINLLKNIIKNKIELDVAFCNISVIMYYIMVKFNSFGTDYSMTEWKIKYLQFFVYFIVWSVIGAKYSKNCNIANIIYLGDDENNPANEFHSTSQDLKLLAS